MIMNTTDGSERKGGAGLDRAPVRMSLTLPGSASLGAFQGGGAAGLAVVVNSLRRHGHDVRIDAIGGASAGSIVGMLFAHCLTTGRDAPELLRDAWVDEVNMDLLRRGGSGAPLAFHDLRDRLGAFLADTDAHPDGVHDPLTAPVTVLVNLTTLLGFTTPIETDDMTSSTLTYTDWMEFRVEPSQGSESVTEPLGQSLLDAVLVSASHPAAFAPKSIDRSADRSAYEDRGITNLPDHGVVWYTDGGLVESEPVGRVLAAARRRTAAGDRAIRLHVVIDPRSSGPTAERQWREQNAEPSWLDGVRRALSVLPTQALHDDLRKIARVNSQLDQFDDLVNRLRSSLGEEAEDLARDIAELAGIDGKERVRIAVISPLLQASDHDAGVGELLTGDFIGAFGGFLDQSIRRSDFALGWSCTRAWVDQSLEQTGIDRQVVDAILDDIDEASRLGLDDVAVTDQSGGKLSWSGRWRLVALAARVGHVLVREALPSPSGIWRSDRDRQSEGDRGDGSTTGEEARQR